MAPSLTASLSAPLAFGFNWKNGGGYGEANDGLRVTEEGVGPLTREQIPAVVRTLTAKMAKGTGGPAGEECQNLIADVAGDELAPRRLTPLECERLMGWPDGWTLVRDERGKLLSDSARYMLCGNGVVSVQPEWIAREMNRIIEEG